MPSGLSAAGLTGPAEDARVHDVTLSVDQGEVVHVAGPNGSGKTTLLRLLAGLDPIQGGDLRLHGRPAREVPVSEWRRRVGLVFQEPRLFPGSVGANLSWAARQHGYAVDPDALMERVGLDLPLDREALSLSGGEAKRVQLARTLAVRPDILLLDEPTAFLDPENRATIQRLVRSLADDGYGVVVVSHIGEDRATMSGKTYVIEHGRLVDTMPQAEVSS